MYMEDITGQPDCYLLKSTNLAHRLPQLTTKQRLDGRLRWNVEGGC